MNIQQIIGTELGAIEDLHQFLIGGELSTSLNSGLDKPSEKATLL
jgi:hypothetical protein